MISLLFINKNGKNLGISNKIVKIFFGCKMKVKIENSYSETLNKLSGAPQVSVQGPLLFLIFINELTNDIKSEIKLFALDVKLFVRALLKETTQMNVDKLSY